MIFFGLRGNPMVSSPREGCPPGAQPVMTSFVQVPLESPRREHVLLRDEGFPLKCLVPAGFTPLKLHLEPGTDLPQSRS